MSNHHSRDERQKTLVIVIVAVCVGAAFLAIGVLGALAVLRQREGTDPVPAPPVTRGIGPGTCLAGLPIGAHEETPVDTRDGLYAVPCGDARAQLWIVSVGEQSCPEWTVTVGSTRYCAEETGARAGS